MKPPFKPPAKTETFVDIASKALKRGLNQITQNSVNWFNQYVRSNVKTGRIPVERLVNSKKMSLAPKLRLGRMYFFAYDAKHKKTLPYWDAAPLVIPIGETKTSIIGLNLHYLPIPFRAKLLDALMELLNNQKMDDTTKMRVTYHTLQAAAKYRYFKPCIKEYLKSNFRSRFIEVPPEDWTNAIFLPVADWQNASKESVYKDSLNIIKGKR